MPLFLGRRVLVTGASRGIGRAIAAAFRAEGAWVLGTRTSPQAEDAGQCDAWLEADFSDDGQLERCVLSVAHSSVDVLVNNAGINRIAPFASISPPDFKRIQQVNVYAPFRLCQAVLPSMLKRGWGRIVNVSSIFGIVSRAQRGAYSASKFALEGLTVALAAEHAADGVLANCVAPGFVDTELTRDVLGVDGIRDVVQAVPARRLADPAEVARVVLFLASAENTFVTGQTVAIDGGFSRV